MVVVRVLLLLLLLQVLWMLMLVMLSAASSTTMLVGVGSVDAPLEYDSAGPNDEPPPPPLLEPALFHPAEPALALALVEGGPAVREENVEVIGGVGIDSCFATLVIALTAPALAQAPAFAFEEEEEEAEELEDRQGLLAMANECSRSAAPRIDGPPGALDDVTVFGYVVVVWVDEDEVELVWAVAVVVVVVLEEDDELDDPWQFGSAKALVNTSGVRARLRFRWLAAV
ncbi:hypothetical protein BDZ97DRAFT_2062489 [Flammula alnicola]|nr:hypothetical protein BDZ97DRAFT_2062489 [Flammula alnicola]